MVMKLQILRGSRHPESKLTEIQVQEIWRLARSGEMTQKKIGEKFGIHGNTVSNIKRRKYWRHVEVGK